jgi:hypothetical protein
LGYIIDAFLLIEVVEHDDLVLFVLVGIQLRNEFVSFYSYSWKIEGLTNMKLLILLRISQVNQYKISVHTNRELLCFNGDRRQIGSLTSRIVLRLIPIVDRLGLFLLVNEFPKGRRLYSSEELALLFRSLLVA